MLIRLQRRSNIGIKCQYFTDLYRYSFLPIFELSNLTDTDTDFWIWITYRPIPIAISPKILINRYWYRYRLYRLSVYPYPADHLGWGSDALGRSYGSRYEFGNIFYSSFTVLVNTTKRSDQQLHQDLVIQFNFKCVYLRRILTDFSKKMLIDFSITPFNRWGKKKS